MSPEKKPLAMNPELREEFEHMKVRYDELGMDFEAFLDETALTHAKKLSIRDIEYPSKGSLEEKWLTLKEGLAASKQERQLQELLDKVRNQVQRIKDAQEKGGNEYREALNSATVIQPDALEEPLSDALDKDPELEPLVKQVRSSLKELRQLTY